MWIIRYQIYVYKIKCICIIYVTLYAIRPPLSLSLSLSPSKFRFRYSIQSSISKSAYCSSLDSCTFVLPQKNSSLELEKLRLFFSDSYFFSVISVDSSPTRPGEITEIWSRVFPPSQSLCSNSLDSCHTIVYRNRGFSVLMTKMLSALLLYYPKDIHHPSGLLRDILIQQCLF